MLCSQVHELIPAAEQYPEDWNTWPVDNLATGSLHPQEKQGKDITATCELTWNMLVVQENITLNRLKSSCTSLLVCNGNDLLLCHLRDVEKIGDVEMSVL
jgi:hypothetical protein